MNLHDIQKEYGFNGDSIAKILELFKLNPSREGFVSALAIELEVDEEGSMLDYNDVQDIYDKMNESEAIQRDVQEISLDESRRSLNESTPDSRIKQLFDEAMQTYGPWDEGFYNVVYDIRKAGRNPQGDEYQTALNNFISFVKAHEASFPEQLYYNTETGEIDIEEFESIDYNDDDSLTPEIAYFPDYFEYLLSEFDTGEKVIGDIKRMMNESKSNDTRRSLNEIYDNLPSQVANQLEELETAVSIFKGNSLDEIDLQSTPKGNWEVFEKDTGSNLGIVNVKLDDRIFQTMPSLRHYDDINEEKELKENANDEKITNRYYDDEDFDIALEDGTVDLDISTYRNLDEIAQHFGFDDRQYDVVVDQYDKLNDEEYYKVLMNVSIPTKVIDAIMLWAGLDEDDLIDVKESLRDNTVRSNDLNEGMVDRIFDYLSDDIESDINENPKATAMMIAKEYGDTSPEFVANIQSLIDDYYPNREKLEEPLNEGFMDWDDDEDFDWDEDGEKIDIETSPENDIDMSIVKNERPEDETFEEKQTFQEPERVSNALDGKKVLVTIPQYEQGLKTGQVITVDYVEGDHVLYTKGRSQFAIPTESVKILANESNIRKGTNLEAKIIAKTYIKYLNEQNDHDTVSTAIAKKYKMTQEDIEYKLSEAFDYDPGKNEEDSADYGQYYFNLATRKGNMHMTRPQAIADEASEEEYADPYMSFSHAGERQIRSKVDQELLGEDATSDLEGIDESEIDEMADEVLVFLIKNSKYKDAHETLEDCVRAVLIDLELEDKFGEEGALKIIEIIKQKYENKNSDDDYKFDEDDYGFEDSDDSVTNMASEAEIDHTVLESVKKRVGHPREWVQTNEHFIARFYDKPFGDKLIYEVKKSIPAFDKIKEEGNYTLLFFKKN